MKTTITITLPRMGTLALSIMMNTKYCLSHHEVSQSMFIADLPWEDTYEGRAEKRAHNEGKHYFCPIAYDIVSVQKRLAHAEMHNESIQILCIFPGFEYEEDHRKGVMMACRGCGFDLLYDDLCAHDQKLADDMFNLVEKEHGRGRHQVRGVEKKSRLYTMDQLTEIAKFTGALYNDDPNDLSNMHIMDNIEYLSQCELSLSKELLTKNIQNGMDIVLANAPG
jgi:hypothetical protein